MTLIKKSYNILTSSKTKGDDHNLVGGRIISSSAHKIQNCSHDLDPIDTKLNSSDDITLLLFYQYIEPLWDDLIFNKALNYIKTISIRYKITGRVRLAREGLNCTLTGLYMNVRKWCKLLRNFEDGKHFSMTEFKLTDHLPHYQKFTSFNLFKVEELVTYGLAEVKTKSFLPNTGRHIEPTEYHAMLNKSDTVLVDVRNHYECLIGKFCPPKEGATYIDPKMRKSTDFPLWLDKPETKELFRNKNVIMYCTGGVRCEKASALLLRKMDTDYDMQNFGIKGVYQLQGGIEKYFKIFPDGGWWKGKNYVFDKRFSHVPILLEERNTLASKNRKRGNRDENFISLENGRSSIKTMYGTCVVCQKDWDSYRGKRRCSLCGVPSLICKHCNEKKKLEPAKLDSSIRCHLCIEEGIISKMQYRDFQKKNYLKYQKLTGYYGINTI